MSKTKQQSRFNPEVILFLGCIVIAVLPLVLRKTSCGHDFDFHFESWMETVRQWHQRVLYPHWEESANFQAGEPRFVFYPPFTWILGAILGVLLPWSATQMAFTTLCLLAMGASFYKMAREWIPDRNAALAACFYILNPYIFFVIYERTAYGELLAAAWLPLLVLYALRKHSSTLQLALVVAALWLTNAPAAVMGSYALAILTAFAAVTERRWNLISRAASGITLGLGLTGFYLIPAIYEQRWVEITRAVGPGMRPWDSFLFQHTGMSYHDEVLRAASWIAVAMLAATILAALLSQRNSTCKNRAARAPLLILAAIIAFLLVKFSKPIWLFAPKIQFLQFPWRWLLILSLILAFLTGTAFGREPIARRQTVFRAVPILLLACILTWVGGKYFWQPCDDYDRVSGQLTTIDQEGFNGTDEYTVTPADNGDIQYDLPQVRVVDNSDGDMHDSTVSQNPEYQPIQQDLMPAQIQIQRWQVEHRTVTIQTKQPGFAVLLLMDYPAWSVKLNNAPVRNRPRRDDGLLTIPIAAGTSTIDVRYTTTPDVWAGRALSLFSIALWLALAARIRRQRVIIEANASRNSS